MGVATNLVLGGGAPRTKKPASLGVGGTQYEKAFPWDAAVWDTSDSPPPPSATMPELRASKLLPVSAWLHPNWKPVTASAGVMVSRSELYVPCVEDPSG